MTKAISSAEVEIVNSELTADEFLDLIAGYEEQYPLGNGRYARIRSLTYPEVKQLARANKGDDNEIELAALVAGTVFPQLTDEHIARLRQSAAGPLMNMAKRIMVISGMIDDDKAMGEDGASS